MTASPPPADALPCPDPSLHSVPRYVGPCWCWCHYEERLAAAAAPAPGLDEDARGALCLALARQQPSVKPSEIEAQADDLIASLKFMRYGIARLAGQEGGE